MTACRCSACRSMLHASDCAVHNGPALPAGPCDCAELHSQDGWDWPNGVSDERWPSDEVQPLPDAYWQAMKALGEEL